MKQFKKEHHRDVRGKEKKKGSEKIVQGTTAENFPNQGNKTCLPLQEAWSTKEDQAKEVHNKTHFN